MKIQLIIIWVFLIFSCELKQKESIKNDPILIIDTLKYGEYYKEIGEKDHISLRIYEATSDSLITHLVDGISYKVRFEIPRLEYLEVIPDIYNNGSLDKLDEFYLLKVNRTDDINYMQINFSIDLKGDSILIQNRVWADSTKSSYNESFSGFIPRGAFRISIKENPIRS